MISTRTGYSTAIAATLTLGFACAAEATTFRCNAEDVSCLIQAIQAANASGLTENTISVAASTYTLLNADNMTDGANGLPSITSRLTIVVEAPGTAILTRATAAPAFRLLHIGRGGNLTLRGVIVTNGSAPQGGGLFNNGGTLTIVNGAVTHNSATEGGGLFNAGGAVTVTNGTIDNNFAFTGGGISNTGELTLDLSTLTLNRSANGAGLVTADSNVHITRTRITRNSADIGQAGGVLVRSGTVFIAGTSFVQNFADNGSAAIWVQQQGALTVSRSSFVENLTYGGSAAIFNQGSASVDNTTFARNRGAFNRSGDPGAPITIANFGTLRLISSTLAGNTAGTFNSANFVLGSIPGASTFVQNTLFSHDAAESAQDCSGTITSLGNNILSHLAGCTIILQTTDLVRDAGLAAFADNGEPGNGHFPLLPPSPAINAGNDEACGETDQIGHERKHNRHCDIGAIQFKRPEAIDDGYDSIQMNEGDWPSVVPRQQ